MWQPSHPAWGEWIEIFLLTIISKIARSLTPHGASGLRYKLRQRVGHKVAGLTPYGMSGLK